MAAARGARLSFAAFWFEPREGLCIILTVDALSTIRLLESIDTLDPMLELIHVFLDNAHYHRPPDHSPRVEQEWLAQPEVRIVLHFIPAYRPHLDPVERLWGVMHKHVAHNKCYATSKEFADATLGFPREKVPKNRPDFCHSITDNFRVNSPMGFRVTRWASHIQERSDGPT
ncbi:MAG: transposase [Methylocella sp.]